jgi:hypothetical protein
VPNRVVHVKRWQLVTVFVFMMLSLVIAAILLNNQITELRHDKANITTLEKSNCKIKSFLISSARFRERRIPLDKTIKQKRADKKAVKVSLNLANSFSNELCPTERG